MVVGRLLGDGDQLGGAGTGLAPGIVPGRALRADLDPQPFEDGQLDQVLAGGDGEVVVASVGAVGLAQQPQLSLVQPGGDLLHRLVGLAVAIGIDPEAEGDGQPGVLLALLAAAGGAGIPVPDIVEGGAEGHGVRA